LSGIIVGGESLEGFDAEQFDYNIVLPYGTTELPEISATAQGSASCSDISIDTTENTATINVLSQDGSINTYNLAFSIALSDNSSLLDISLGGVSLPDFNSDTLFYKIIHPIGTKESELLGVDDVSYVKGDENQLVAVSSEINDVGNLVIIIVVTAQNGVSQRAYVIEHIILKSNNALLADIIIDGKSLEGFAPTKFYYEYILKFGATTVPDIEYVKAEEAQQVEIDPSPEYRHVNDTTFIYVKAEDGTEIRYSIYFKTSDKNPGEKPTKDDVCFDLYADGVWKASSSKNNVSIRIFDTAGRLAYKSNVPVSDPNNDVCKGEIGSMFRVERKGKIYIWVFIYNNKERIYGASGKFVY
jgi:hypothetical protein